MGYKFEIITDSRFTDKYSGDDIKTAIEKMIKSLSEKLSILNEITFEILEPRLLDGWEDGTKQYRAVCYINKSTRQITWDHIFGVINSVYAPYYQKI